MPYYLIQTGYTPEMWAAECQQAMQKASGSSYRPPQ